MFLFNFNTKKKKMKSPHKDFAKVLKKIEHVVSPYLRLYAEPQDCGVIEMFHDKNLFVSYPPAALEEVEILTYNHTHDKSWKGTLWIRPGFKRSFSIKGKTMYIGK